MDWASTPADSAVEIIHALIDLSNHLGKTEDFHKALEFLDKLDSK